ncbi:MAG: sialidase family protein [Pyrinomonadaceae bacterium]
MTQRTHLVTYMKLCRAIAASLMLAAVALSGCRRSASNREIANNGAADSPLAIRLSESPAGADSREPDLSATSDGRVILSWIQKVGEKHYALRMAERDATGWSEVRTVAEGENWFINWADFPSVIALKDGSLAAHWLVKSAASTYAYDVNIARSKDRGKTWDKPIVPHRDMTQTEHGFVSLIALADGRVGAVWLDGRNLKAVKDEDEHSALKESMTLRYAAIDAEGKLSDEAQLDDRVCECCQTSAALSSHGVIVAYRDRSTTEVRDISVVRSATNASWSSAQTVYPDNWQISACPVNGPAIVAEGSRVAIAWFTEAGGQPHVNIAFSNDSGATFGNKIQVDDGNTVGRVDALLLPDGSALVCWLAGTVESGAIKVRRIQSNGAMGTVATIAKTDIARSSGFPRMARLQDEVFFAWTEFGKPSHVRVASAKVSGYK